MTDALESQSRNYSFSYFDASPEGKKKFVDEFSNSPMTSPVSFEESNNDEILINAGKC